MAAETKAPADSSQNTVASVFGRFDDGSGVLRRNDILRLLNILGMPEADTGLQALLDECQNGNGDVSIASFLGLLFGNSGDASLPSLDLSAVPEHLLRRELCKRGPSVNKEQVGKPGCVSLFLFSDPGQDLDDEMTFIMLRYLVDIGVVEVKGIVCTLAPAFDRARLCRGTLDALGLFDVPVGIGTDGGDTKGIHKAETFEKWAHSYMPSPFSESSSSLEPGRRLTYRVYQTAAPKSLTVVIIASLKDAALFLRDNEALFVAKTKEVVIMGGVESFDNSKVDANGDAVPVFLTPDAAHNQEFDKAASEFLYRRCQELGVPLVVNSRWSAYAAKAPRSLYDDIAALGSCIGCRLRNAQRASIEHLWVRACAPAGSPDREGLPPRCDKNWFVQTFCGGCNAGLQRNGCEPIWDLIVGFMQYDAIATLTGVPQFRDQFFKPVEVTGHRGVKNLVVGRTQEDHNVTNPEELVRFLESGFRNGVRLNLRNTIRFVLLTEPRWCTRADNLMTCVLLRTLYSIGLVDCEGIVISPGPEDNQDVDVEEAANELRDFLANLGMARVPVYVGKKYQGDDVVEFIKQLYDRASPAGVTLVVAHSLGEVNRFTELHPKIFQERTRQVVLMGGAITEGSDDSSQEQKMLPDPQARNNSLDMAAASSFYHTAQALMVPLTIISRHFASALHLPYSFFEMLDSSAGTVGAKLRNVTDDCLRKLWLACGSPLDKHDQRMSLPDRCDRDWFAKTFCPGAAVETANDSCPKISNVIVYTPLALLAALPHAFSKLASCTYLTVRSTRHSIVGASATNPGVVDPRPIVTLIMQCLCKGTRLNASEFNLTSFPEIQVQGAGWKYNESEEALEWLLPEKQAKTDEGEFARVEKST